MTTIKELLNKYKDVTSSSKEEMAKAYAVIAKEYYESSLPFAKKEPLWDLKNNLRDKLVNEYRWYLKAIEASELTLRFFRDPKHNQGKEDWIKEAIEGLNKRNLEGVNNPMYKEGSQRILEAITILENQLTTNRDTFKKIHEERGFDSKEDFDRCHNATYNLESIHEERGFDSREDYEYTKQRIN